MHLTRHPNRATSSVLRTHQPHPSPLPCFHLKELGYKSRTNSLQMSLGQGAPHIILDILDTTARDTGYTLGQGAPHIINVMVPR